MLESVSNVAVCLIADFDKLGVWKALLIRCQRDDEVIIPAGELNGIFVEFKAQVDTNFVVMVLF